MCGAITASSTAVCWGSNKTAQLGVWTPAANVRPLQVAVQALEFEDDKYATSWYEGPH